MTYTDGPGKGAIAIIATIITFFLFMIFAGLSGGCGVEKRVLDGAAVLNDAGQVVARSLVVQEKPGWFWQGLGWGDVIRVWNNAPRVERPDDAAEDHGSAFILGRTWVADSGHSVLGNALDSRINMSEPSPQASNEIGDIGHIELMWRAWYAQARTGMKSQYMIEDEELMQKVREVLNEEKVKRD